MCTLKMTQTIHKNRTNQPVTENQNIVPKTLIIG